MQRYVTKDPFETATAISRKIKANTDKDVSRFTASHRLNEIGFTTRSPAIKPFISNKNRNARLEYAEARVVWRDEDWDRVHFSDESKFDLLVSDGRQFVIYVSQVTDLTIDVLKSPPNLKEGAVS